ncbi:DUF726-domain-containing protein [Coniochaeta ligniaria NRRL 30616]|uniref:DUF726-domain-containing protein n=1 Tax=Coniochaeta ligniaria NRRL 30616 TaxID=1408157 RepID=A0A1J7IY51_9PEZI|nr:DUF726-domain-containing protein [Coniochaeta ligniaria NRRL 30616]
MAPLTSDPQLLLVVLNPARRKALYTLTAEITSYMQSQLKLPDPTPSPSSSRTGEAPLFHPSSRQTSSPSTPTTPDPSLSPSQPSPDLLRLRAAALSHFNSWRRTTLSKLESLLNSPDTPTILSQRRARASLAAQTPSPGESLIDFGVSATASSDDDTEAQRRAAVAALQAAYHPIPTRLATLPLRDREEVLSAVLLVLLSTGTYSAESRVLVVYLASALEVPLAVLVREETEIAVGLVEGAGSGGTTGMSADAEALRRKEQGQSSRFWKVGLASVAGAAVIGVTGGLAAPVVAGAIGGLMGTVGLGGVASFLGIFWMNGALVGTLFGAFGGRMTGEIVDQYAREVEDFRFIPLREEWGRELSRGEGEGSEGRRLKVVIGVNGWLTSKEDVTKPWRSLGQESEVFALRYEMNCLLALGQSLQGMVSSYAWSVVRSEILKRTVLATLWSALWPAYMLSVASSLDNPFSLAKNRSEKAGKILADALINRVQGERPVTLIGYSLGARVIYSCLRTLAERRAFGLVEDVVFIGAPIPSNRNHWQMMRSVVSGKMFNVYSENDYILAFLYRATSMQLGIAGLQEIQDIEGVENLNLTEEVQGHLRYAGLIGNILVRCGFPDIRGTDGTIKKDEEVISLQDADLGRMGTLIQLDDLRISEEDKPPRTKGDSPAKTSPKQGSVTYSPVSRSPEQRKLRNTITRKQSESLQADFDPLATPSDSTSRAARPQLGREPSDTSKFVMEDSNTKYSGTVRDFALGKAETTRAGPNPPPYTPSVTTGVATPDSSSVASYQRDDEEDESEEESYGGISMVDNDDDFAYVEPIPLED